MFTKGFWKNPVYCSVKYFLAAFCFERSCPFVYMESSKKPFRVTSVQSHINKPNKQS